MESRARTLEAGGGRLRQKALPSPARTRASGIKKTCLAAGPKAPSVYRTRSRNSVFSSRSAVGFSADIPRFDVAPRHTGYRGGRPRITLTADRKFKLLENLARRSAAALQYRERPVCRMSGLRKTPIYTNPHGGHKTHSPPFAAFSARKSAGGGPPHCLPLTLPPDLENECSRQGFKPF